MDSLTEGFPGASYFEILRRRLPEYKLLNRGKSGDTVISLYRRLRNSPIDDPVDIAFLWVGTNDVFPKISWSYPVIKTLNNQPWAKSPGEFEKYFRLTLVILSQRAGKVITVPPLFMGEQINNRWSQEMKELSEIIERVSASDKSVEFLDLRKIIFPKLKDKSVSDYIPTSAVKVLWMFYCSNKGMSSTESPLTEVSFSP